MMLSIYNFDQVLELLNIKPTTLEKLVRENRISYRKVGTSKLFTEEDLLEFIDKVKVDAGESQKTQRDIASFKRDPKRLRSLKIRDRQQKESHDYGR